MSLENIKKLREMTGAGFADVKKALDESHNNLDKAVEWLRINGISKAAKKADNIASEGVVISTIEGNTAAIIEINSQTDFVAKNVEFVDFSKKVATAIIKSGLTGKEKPEEVKEKVSVNSVKLSEAEANMTAKIGEKIAFRRFEIIKGDVIANYNHSNSRVAVIISGSGIDAALLRDIAIHSAVMNPKFVSMDAVSPEYKAKETEILKEQYRKQFAGDENKLSKLDFIVGGAVNKQISEFVLYEQAYVKEPNKKIKDLIGSGKIHQCIRFEVGEGIEKASNNFAEEVAKAAGL